MNIAAVDQLVAEYLVYRGFTQSFRSLEAEKAKDRTKQFEVSRIVETIFNYLHSFEIEQFIILWDFLSKRFFFHLDGEHLSYSVMLKSELIKYYLVNAFKANKRDKVTEFFTMYSHEILSESGDHVAGNLRGWFVLPYMDEPEKDTEFVVYFSQRWADNLRTTIGNFLSIVLSTAPAPKLLLLERWFHSEAQQELRMQLSVSSKKVDALLTRLEKSEERLSTMRTALRDLVQHVQKITVTGAAGASSSVRPSHSSGLFESDEEADLKRAKAKELGQAVCKTAQDCVHKAAHLTSMSKEVRMREMLGDSASLFLPKSVASSNATVEEGAAGRTASSVAELETNLILLVNQWIKHISL